MYNGTKEEETLHFPRLEKNIGTVHDIDDFSFLAEIEDYYYKKQNQEVKVEIIQGRTSTGGSLHLRITHKHGSTGFLNHHESLQLIEKVFGFKPDEVYTHFAAHIVYFIVLKQ